MNASIPVVLKASDEASALDFWQLMEDSVLREPGGVWRLIQGAICNGIEWPIWWAQHIIDRDRYFEQTAGLAFLCDTKFANDAAARAEKWRRVDICVALQGLVSEDVHFPDFYETISLVSSEDVIPQIRWMSDYQLQNYVIQCYEKHRLFSMSDVPLADDNFWPEEADELEARGLVTSGISIPLRVLLSGMRNADLRTLLLKFGKKPYARRLDNEAALYALSSLSPDVVEAIRLAGTTPELRCKMPPQGVTWEQLQAYRWQIRGMIGTLYDFLQNPQTLRHRFPAVFAEIFKDSGLDVKNCGFIF